MPLNPEGPQNFGTLDDTPARMIPLVEPAELEPALVDELAKDQASAGGWSSSNDTREVKVRRAKEDNVELSPACALAAYDALAARGKYVNALVMPVATQ